MNLKMCQIFHVMQIYRLIRHIFNMSSQVSKKRKYSVAKRIPFYGPRYSQSSQREYGRRTGIPKVLKYKGPLPPRHRCTLKYFMQAQLSGTGSDQQWFRANSLFDPDYTGAGTQPSGFDELAALYNKYLVHKIRIRAAVTANGSNSRPITFGACIKDNPTAMATSELAFTQPGSSPWVLQNYTGNTQYLTWEYDLAKVSGQTPAQWRSEENNGALVTADPSDVVWLIFHAVYADQTATGFDAYINVSIEFDSEFLDAKLLPES